MTRRVIAAIGWNRRAPGSRHLPNGRLLAPDCVSARSRTHRAPYPKTPNRVAGLRFRPKHKCATVFGGWEESSGKSQPNLRLSVFGLGHVGSVSAACFAKDGREVIGVDSQQVKVDLINQGKAPIIEAGLGELILEMVTAGRLRATANAAEAVAESDISMVCVGTPSQANGNLDVRSIVRVCEEIGIALREKEGFHVCQDTKLHLSPCYLKPGFGFGWSCLPKDLRALTYKARTLDLALPVLDSILPSNRIQTQRAIRMITEKGRRRIGVLGFSFKAGTDDLRESPLVELIERLIGKGYDLRLYDSNVNLARVVGANREYILRAIPHISTLMVETVEEVLEHGEVIVIGNSDPDFHDVPSRLKPHQILVDMVRVPGGEGLAERYNGINR